jgi:hypothetical protein
MTTLNWKAMAERKRLRAQGIQPMEPRGVVLPPRGAAEAKRAERLQAYLEGEPSGRRDVEAMLDALAEGRKEREKWLRGILEAWADERQDPPWRRS